MKTTRLGLSVGLQGALGALAAVAMTAGLFGAMALDLQRSHQPALAFERRGVVRVESGAEYLPVLPAAPVRRGVVIVESGADYLPAGERAIAAAAGDAATRPL